MFNRFVVLSSRNYDGVYVAPMHEDKALLPYTDVAACGSLGAMSAAHKLLSGWCKESLDAAHANRNI